MVRRGSWVQVPLRALDDGRQGEEDVGAPAGTFRCALDGKRARDCTSPHTYRRLKPGRHRFTVTAVDAAGNADPTAAKKRFKIPKRKHGKHR